MPTPKRVLVCVGGHLGDAVIATSLLSQLQRAIPAVEIGVLTGSWNRRVFETHPRVRWVHALDHWKSSRAGTSLVTRWLTTRRMRARAVSELLAVGYDAALDLSPYFPNFATTIDVARIPIRVGYTSGGDGPRYTHAVDWIPGRHIAEDHLVLLEQLVPTFTRTVVPRYELGGHAAETSMSTERKLKRFGVLPKSYAVMHVGAGVSRKEWQIEKWIAVARDLASTRVPIVLTGTGTAQVKLARSIESRIDGIVNLCDRLDWDEFRWVIAQARVVLSVDTVAMHLAAAEGVPCVAVMAAMDDPQRWRPLSDQFHLLTHDVPCAPCYRSRGCREMSCVRDVTPESMLREARRYLEPDHL